MKDDLFFMVHVLYCLGIIVYTHSDQHMNSDIKVPMLYDIYTMFRSKPKYQF